MKNIIKTYAMLFVFFTSACIAENKMEKEEFDKSAIYLEIILVYSNVETLPIVVDACTKLDASMGKDLGKMLDDYVSKHKNTYVMAKEITSNPDKIDWLTDKLRENARRFDQSLAKKKRELTEEYKDINKVDKTELSRFCNMLPMVLGF